MSDIRAALLRHFETNRVVFWYDVKRELSSPAPFLKTLVAFANTAGEQGLPEPEIVELGLRLRFIVHLAETIPIQGRAKPGAETGVRPELRPKSKLALTILQLLKEGESSKSQLARLLGHKSVSGELKKQIKHLSDMGLIEMTIPDKPTSRLQKYPLATEQVEIDLDDGVKVNYNKFGKALKKVPGLSEKS